MICFGLLTFQHVERQPGNQRRHEGAGPLERLLGERVASAWLQVNFFDSLVGQRRNSGLAALKELLPFQDSASKRLLAAIKTLSVVKKLLPQVRVDVPPVVDQTESAQAANSRAQAEAKPTRTGRRRGRPNSRPGELPARGRDRLATIRLPGKVHHN